MIAVTVILAIYAVLIFLVLADTSNQRNIQKGTFMSKENNKRDAA
jgi:hypothetical protein